MKRRTKLKLHRETLAQLEPRQLRAAGGDHCTCSCCHTDCNCPVVSDYESCWGSCGCPTNGEYSCYCI